MHRNARRQRAECLFDGLENFRGAILGEQKKLDFGLCMLYLCCREVRLHLSITFENEFSSSAFGLH